MKTPVSTSALRSAFSHRTRPMPQTILLTLGRVPKALDVARALKGAGCRVLVAEPFRWHLCRVSKSVDKSFTVTAPRTSKTAYLSELAGIIEAEKVDRIVAIADEAMHVGALGDRLPAHAALFGPPLEALIDFHDKARFIALCQELDLPAPATAPLGSEAAHALVASRDVIVKRIYTSAGIGLHEVAKGGTLPEPDPEEPALVQEKLTGRLISSCSLVHEGRVLGTALYEATLLMGTVAIAFQRVEDASAAETWITQFAEKTNYSGFLSFDFFLDERGVARAIECNPRVTSGISFFQPADVARGILEPEALGAIGFKETKRFQMFYPCLTETQISLFRRKNFRENFRAMRRSRDVTWSKADPLPFLTMTFTSYEIIMASIRSGDTFGEASVADIKWDSRDAPAPRREGSEASVGR